MTMYGHEDRRRHLPGPGRVVVRQRKLLHQPDGPHHQVLRRAELSALRIRPGDRKVSRLFRAIFSGEIWRQSQRMP